MIWIEHVEPGSLGAAAGFAVGDGIERVNGVEICDVIDFQVHTAERDLVLSVERDGELYEVEMIRNEGASLGLEFRDIKLRKCNNNCVFCFVRQLPKGMRSGLYFRDDDFRLSFLHGSYVTLTNVSAADIGRIIDQALSPLFISVHATDPALRQRLLGRRTPGVDILAHIKRLAEGGIRMHCQVVLCPGLNDGAQLERTLADLARFHPAVRSVALVPVGLTRFRQGLPTLEPVTSDKALQYVQIAGAWGETCKKKLGERFVYLADELMLMAGRSIPASDYYGSFPQLENGIGMVRSFLDLWRRKRSDLAGRSTYAARIALVTGRLGARFLAGVVNDIHALTDLQAELVVVDNSFLGSGITVSGLLTGEDIIRALAGRGGLDMVFLPPNCVNEEGITLDDLSTTDISRRVGIPVEVGRYDLASTLVSHMLAHPRPASPDLRPWPASDCHYPGFDQ